MEPLIEILPWSAPGPTSLPVGFDLLEIRRAWCFVLLLFQFQGNMFSQTGWCRVFSSPDASRDGHQALSFTFCHRRLKMCGVFMIRKINLLTHSVMRYFSSCNSAFSGFSILNGRYRFCLDSAQLKAVLMNCCFGGSPSLSWHCLTLSWTRYQILWRGLDLKILQTGAMVDKAIS